MSQFSTSLPPGFTTWNELCKQLKKTWNGVDESIEYQNNSEVEPIIFEAKGVKARAFDEIMDIEVNEELDYNNRMISFAEEFKELTNKKL